MSTIDLRPCFIYAITHLVSGRRYVGSCLDPIRRWIVHRSQLKHNKHHCSHLQRAWNRYGSDEFSFSVILRLETNESKVRAKAELEAIAEIECFNSRIADLGLTNFLNNPETRHRIKAGLSKRISEDEELRSWLTLRGKALADHARTPERRAIRSLLTTKLWQDTSHRERISRALAEYWNKPGIREAHSERVKRIRSTPEARKRNSENIKKAWADPTSGFHTRKPTRWTDPDAKVKQAAKMREVWARRRLQEAE